MRSGRVIDNKVGVGTSSPVPQETSKSEKSKPEEKESPAIESESSSHKNGKQTVDPVEIVPKAPYPQALEKPKSSEESRMFKILEHLKDLKINLPLINAILSIPAYSKFFKDLCTRKRSNSSMPKKVKLTEKVSSICTSGIPPKLSDPGAFTIPCRIRETIIDHALLDLGSSVNLIPYSVYLQLGMGTLSPTHVTVQLVV